MSNNREFSQLASNIQVNENSNFIGIATEGNYSVGIATSSFKINSSGLVEIKSIQCSDNISLSVGGISTLGTVKISSGIVTATSGVVTYYGDGSKLSNIISGIAVQDQGSTVGTSVTTLNFSGATVSVSNAVNGISTITVTASGIITYVDNAGIATNLKGGLAGNIPYQSAPDATTFLVNGASGTILQSNGVGNAPSWVPATSAGAISGITIRDEGTDVGTAGSITTINFVGNIVSAAATAGIATITFLDYVSNAGVATYATSAGVSTNLKGGLVGNIPYQSATDTTVFLANGSSGQILQSNGVGNAPTWVSAAPAAAITGLTIRDEGNIVGTANSVSQLNFVGSNITAIASGSISTITVSDNLVGSALSISGISTLGVTSTTNLTSQQLNVSGVSTFSGITTHTTSLFGTQASFTGVVTASSFSGSLALSNITGLAANVSTFLATPSSANLASALTDETGTGANVFANTPSLTTPAIGSGGFTLAGSTSGTTTVVAPAIASGTATFFAGSDTVAGIASAQTLTNKTINLTSNTLVATSAQLAAALTDETGTGANVFATSPTLVTPILGTPTSGTLTNCTGYTAANLASAGTGITTFLVTPSSANLASAVTDETGSGSLVFATSPTLVSPTLGNANATTINVSGISTIGNFRITPVGSGATVGGIGVTYYGDGSLLTGVSGGLTVTDDTSTNATRYILFDDATSGTITGINVSSTKLTFNPSTGNLVAGGTVTANSDENLKTNIKTIENALHKVLSLRGVEYDRTDTGDHQIGVIAQEVQEIIPDVVYPKQPSPDYETKSVAYGNLVGLLIEAIKEQNQKIVELERKLEEK